MGFPHPCCFTPGWLLISMRLLRDSYPMFAISIWYISQMYSCSLVNYNNSRTWIKAIWGWFPLLTMIPVRSQWGRYNLPRYIYIINVETLQKLTSIFHSDMWKSTVWDRFLANSCNTLGYWNQKRCGPKLGIPRWPDWFSGILFRRDLGPGEALECQWHGISEVGNAFGFDQLIHWFHRPSIMSTVLTNLSFKTSIWCWVLPIKLIHPFT